MLVFDLNDVQQYVKKVCDEIPGLLGRHSITSDLVAQVTGLRADIDKPFTVAIVGQMRVGKSSLINALLEKDIAITGVTETTATVNWIHHGTDPNIARVHWRDRPPETIPRGELDKWTGDSELAANTRSIELFDDAAFLKIASIVDTPGLRSVIAAHESATESFIGINGANDKNAERCADQTQQLGLQADAIVYVIMPVARETDDQFLDAFRNATRLPGSSNYNSIAVLHKWETLNTDDLLDERDRKASKIAASLSEHLATVLPVSAPLARAVFSLNDRHWQTILELGKPDNDSIREKMLRHERAFVRELPECSVAVAERKDLLLLGVPWPSLRTIIGIAANVQGTSINELRQRVRAISQIDDLKQILEQRFFSRSRAIKMLRLTTRASQPCQLAMTRLQNETEKLKTNLNRSSNVLALLQQRIELGDTDLQSVVRHTQESQQVIESQLEKLTDTLETLGERFETLQTIHDGCDGDLAGIEAIAESQLDELPAELRDTLRYVFGQHGVSVGERMRGLHRSRNPSEAIVELVGTLRGYVDKGSPRTHHTCQHAIDRLEQLYHHIELSGQREKIAS
ncbi:dynamin family protein [Aporhodopirellula aestuarii]|uniref:Dynamin family protein n=1 Tax=Aporhodopirellula aestuarii TaxID=2950107 RepID=A0ABT0U651_9BACT|nr:dynamin family protein [Aporhodopirellula aestuarii]MCM2371873.1 dynamin family protein [Aporhodopirellula aestuarii]